MYQQELFLSTIYIAGLFSFFSPCIFPIIPMYLSILSNGEKKSISKTMAFVTGLSTTFIALGFGAGVIGEIFFNNKIRLIAGFIIVILGLFQMEIIKLDFLNRTKVIEYELKNTSIFSSFLLGLTFSLGWTPCIGPILASILVVASSSKNTMSSIIYMFVYVLGMATPFIIFSLFSKLIFTKISFVKKYLFVIKKIGGFLIIIMGLLLIFNKLNMILTF